jgi:hypothetical protein
LNPVAPEFTPFKPASPPKAGVSAIVSGIQEPTSPFMATVELAMTSRRRWGDESEGDPGSEDQTPIVTVATGKGKDCEFILIGHPRQSD